VTAEIALRGANDRFAERVRRVVGAARARGVEPETLAPDELDRLWQAAKAGV
jgi:uncharacterized protein YabN with tetrapyrrole methylase and pyrophosphatase domain